MATSKLEKRSFLHKCLQKCLAYHAIAGRIQVQPPFLQNSVRFYIKERLISTFKDKLHSIIYYPINISNETQLLFSLNHKKRSNDFCIELIIKTIQLLQRNEPSFIKNYKSGKTDSLLETDFRDVLYRTFGLSHDISVSAESLSKTGRTDLRIEGSNFGAKTFEFKIWGSNDYKGVITQLLSYLTSFEREGFVFMINKNKDSILNKYLQNIQKPEMSFIPSSLSKFELDGFEYFSSKHRILDNEIVIYHFVYNIF